MNWAAILENVILFPTETPSPSNPTRAVPVLYKQRLGGLVKFNHRKAA